MIKRTRDLGSRACDSPIATKEVFNRPYVVSGLIIGSLEKTLLIGSMFLWFAARPHSASVHPKNNIVLTNFRGYWAGIL